MNWASEVLAEHLAQCRDIHRLFGQQPLQFRVLVLGPLQALRLADIHANILGLPLVFVRIADEVLAPKIGDRTFASCSSRMPMLWSSMNLLHFISGPFD